jgi:hypothetical protein
MEHTPVLENGAKHVSPVDRPGGFDRRRPLGRDSRPAELLAEVAEGVTYVNGERVKLSQVPAEAKVAV